VRNRKENWSGFDQTVYENIIPSLIATEDIPKTIEKNDLKQSLFLLYWTERQRFNNRDVVARWLKGALRNIIVGLQYRHYPSMEYVIKDSDFHDLANYVLTSQELEVYVLRVGNAYQFITNVKDYSDEDTEVDDSYQRWYVATVRRLINKIFAETYSRPYLTNEQCDAYLNFLLRKVTKEDFIIILKKTHALPCRSSRFINRLNKQLAAGLFKEGLVSEQKLMALGISGWRERLGIVEKGNVSELTVE